jgi:hypothetical protein
MGKNDGSGDSIYGQIPDGGADTVIKQAMDNADDFFSNTINGPVKTKDSQYPEKE